MGVTQLLLLRSTFYQRAPWITTSVSGVSARRFGLATGRKRSRGSTQCHLLSSRNPDGGTGGRGLLPLHRATKRLLHSMQSWPSYATFTAISPRTESATGTT